MSPPTRTTTTSTDQREARSATEETSGRWIPAPPRWRRPTIGSRRARQPCRHGGPRWRFRPSAQAAAASTGEDDVSDQALLRDLIDIPDEVHAGDFVLALAKGVGAEVARSPTTWSPTQLAAHFDQALGLITVGRGDGTAHGPPTWTARSAPARATSWRCCTRSSPATPDARGKKEPGGRRRQARPVAARAGSSCSCRTTCRRPDAWTRRILGGYVAHVVKRHPGAPLPAVLRGRRAARRRRATCAPA